LFDSVSGSLQALCSLALHVPFDVMVRELEGVIYDVEVLHPPITLP